jgi:hypothetical protein
MRFGLISGGETRGRGVRLGSDAASSALAAKLPSFPFPFTRAGTQAWCKNGTWSETHTKRRRRASVDVLTIEREREGSKRKKERKERKKERKKRKKRERKHTQPNK